MRIREAQKHPDPDADAEPVHWYIYIILKIKSHKEVTCDILGKYVMGTVVGAIQ
jgi:hypothetical protein